MKEAGNDDIPVSQSQGDTQKMSRRFERERIVPIIDLAARIAATPDVTETEDEAFISIGIDLGTT